MGLDMYLTEKVYLPYYRHTKEDVRTTVEEIVKLVPHISELEEPGSISVEFTAMYWRKSNAIHNWFVQNVQGGNDDCGTYYVDDSDIRKLMAELEEAIDTRDSGILPPTEGFFFGSTAIDQYYWEDLEHTLAGLNELMSRLESIKERGGTRYSDFYYHSSW